MYMYHQQIKIYASMYCHLQTDQSVIDRIDTILFTCIYLMQFYFVQFIVKKRHNANRP